MHADVVVIGAGPAGLAAAVAASRMARNVVLLDAGERPGGQYWRHRDGAATVGATPVPGAATDQQGLSTFQRLRAGLSDVDYRARTSVWFVEQDTTVHTDRGRFRGDRLILATGAYDRTVALPGWDLPGVFTAGGAQALLKGHGVPIGALVVVAGSGPFLLPVAAGLAQAGARVAGLFEASSLRGYLRGFPPPGKVAEAAGYLATLRRHRVSYRTRRVVTAVLGADRVTGVRVAALDAEGQVVPGREFDVACDALAVGYGFTPQVELAVAVGCDTALDPDGSIVVAVDSGQLTSVSNVYAAGEITGVGGSALALVEGHIAGLAATGQPVPARLIRRRGALRRFAALVARAHPVPQRWADWCADATVLCRCEQVTAGTLREAIADLGVVDGRGAKLMTRAGMGWCQGRTCGYATCQLVAAAAGRAVTPADLLAFANRPIAQPVTLADLAAAHESRSAGPNERASG